MAFSLLRFVNSIPDRNSNRVRFSALKEIYNLKIVLIKPGPTDTPMTAHLKQQGERLASVEDVAGLIVKGINLGKPVVYAPAKWALIMMIIRHLPHLIFNRMDI